MNLQWQLYLYLKSGQKHRYKIGARAERKQRSSVLTDEQNRFLNLPPYSLLKQPKLQPRGTWAIHCSRNSFKQFRKGSKLENLHLSTFVPSVLAPANNLELPLREAVFSFAYDPHDPNILEACTRYGLDVYLFQTDEAVKVYHAGDEEIQLIFPTRSEYNLLRLMSDGGTGLTIKVNGEFYQFDNLPELLQLLEQAF